MQELWSEQRMTSSLVRQAVIMSLSGAPVGRMLDVGCGPVRADYAFAGVAGQITCVDWNVRIIGEVPPHIAVLDGDFTEIDLGSELFDLIICADVFEHVLLEKETDFVARCHELLKPSGQLIVSVPHAGRYAWLDPYGLKPLAHRALSKLGLYSKLHNGTCDIRKGHQHFSQSELEAKFKPFEVEEVRHFGCLAEPLSAWSESLAARGIRVPGQGWIARKLREEALSVKSEDAYSIAMKFRKSL